MFIPCTYYLPYFWPLLSCWRDFKDWTFCKEKLYMWSSLSLTNDSVLLYFIHWKRFTILPVLGSFWSNCQFVFMMSLDWHITTASLQNIAHSTYYTSESSIDQNNLHVEPWLMKPSQTPYKNWSKKSIKNHVEGLTCGARSSHPSQHH